MCDVINYIGLKKKKQTQTQPNKTQTKQMCLLISVLNNAALRLDGNRYSCECS